MFFMMGGPPEGPEDKKRKEQERVARKREEALQAFHSGEVSYAQLARAWQTFLRLPVEDEHLPEESPPETKILPFKRG